MAAYSQNRLAGSQWLSAIPISGQLLAEARGAAVEGGAACRRIRGVPAASMALMTRAAGLLAAIKR
jgi:hypothetical protein